MMALFQPQISIPLELPRRYDYILPLFLLASLVSRQPLISALFFGLFAYRLARAPLAACFPSPPPAAPRRLLCVLGSGGHTTEMLSLLRALPEARYGPRSYVAASTDATSVTRGEAAGVLPAGGGARVLRIPRAREVGQGIVGAVVGTLRGFAASLTVVFLEQPRLLLANGPGTCVPVLAAAALLRAARLLPSDLVVVFVESACRVTSLSLSGRLALRLGLADVVAVQWAPLAAAHPGSVFVGLQV